MINPFSFMAWWVNKPYLPGLLLGSLLAGFLMWLYWFRAELVEDRNGKLTLSGSTTALVVLFSLTGPIIALIWPLVLTVAIPLSPFAGALWWVYRQQKKHVLAAKILTKLTDSAKPSTGTAPSGTTSLGGLTPSTYSGPWIVSGTAHYLPPPDPTL